MKKLFLVSALISALTFPPSHAMHEQAPSLVRTLQSYVQLKRLFFDLAALCCEDDDDDRTFERKDLLKLLRHVKTDKLVQTFALDPVTFNTYFHTSHFRKFIECTLDCDNHRERAESFRKTFKVDAWRQELACDTFEVLLDHVSKILFFEGTHDQLSTLLRTFKEALRPYSSPEHTLSRFFDCAKIMALIDAKLAGTTIPSSQIIEACHLETITEKLPADTHLIKKYSNLHRSLNCIIALCCARSAAELPTGIDLCLCVNWDRVIHDLADRYLIDINLLYRAFDREALAHVIHLFKEGAEITPAAIEAIIKPTVLFFRIKQSELTRYIDCGLFAKGLNDLRKGTPSSALLHAFNTKNISELLGIELVKESRSTVHHNAKLISLGFISCLGLSLAGRALCDECVEVITPHQWYTAWPALAGLVYATYKGADFFKKLPLFKKLVASAVVTKYVRDAQQLLGTRRTIDQQVMGLIPEINPLYGYIKPLTNLLTEKHLQSLDDPAKIMQAYTDPQNLLKNELRCIESMCKDDQEHTPARLQYLIEQLERSTPFEHLRHAEKFDLFAELLVTCKPDALQLLPHPLLLVLARYHPEILDKYGSFIRSAATISHDNESIITLLNAAIEEAKEDQQALL